MISPDFLELLRCPETRQPLRLADEVALQKLGLTDALVTEDGHRAYPVRDGIPVLLAEEAILL